MWNARRILLIMPLVMVAGMPAAAEAADGTHPLLAMLLWLGAPVLMICAGLGFAAVAQAQFFFRLSRKSKAERARKARPAAALVLQTRNGAPSRPYRAGGYFDGTERELRDRRAEAWSSAGRRIQPLRFGRRD